VQGADEELEALGSGRQVDLGTFRASSAAGVFTAVVGSGVVDLPASVCGLDHGVCEGPVVANVAVGSLVGGLQAGECEIHRDGRGVDRLRREDGLAKVVARGIAAGELLLGGA
jgi:hypothetical protein